MFPIIGTACLAGGFLVLTRLQYNTPYLYIAFAMLLIGLGLGQLMQTLTIASQNSVGLRDMGVATSASTFFRQIGGTLGTAVLVSLLFTVLPANFQSAFADKATLTTALDAAFDPAVASAPENKAIMDKIYTPIVSKATEATMSQLQAGITRAQESAKNAVAEQVAAGKIPAAAQPAAEAAAVAAATKAAGAAIEKQVPAAQVASDGTVSLDFSNDAARKQFVDTAVSHLPSSGSGSSKGSSVDTNDTSFLNGADPSLSKPVLIAFTESMVTVYWVALFVVFIAFILSLFFRTPPLRAKSALQEAHDDARMQAKIAADETGALVEPF
jgi:hypothetical protein